MSNKLSRRERNKELYQRLEKERTEGISSSGLEKFAVRLSRLEKRQGNTKKTISEAQTGRHRREMPPAEPIRPKEETVSDLLQEALEDTLGEIAQYIDLKQVEAEVTRFPWV